MMDAKEAGERPLPVTAKKANGVVGINEIFG